MTPQQIVAIFVRFASLWFVVSAWQAFGIGIATVKYGENLTLVTEILVAVYLVLAFVCWLFPMAIAHFLVPNTKFENVIKLQPYQAIFVACVVLGLWVCVIVAAPFISTYISVGIIVLHNGQPLSVIDAVENKRFFAGVIELIVGLLLIFKASFLAKKIVSLQSEPAE